MLTTEEQNLLTLSATKQDYYQVWNELLEVASKLSTRWDPTNTNESDPGIVLLKVLTAITDKLNYNIDKKTLEMFLPTCAEWTSMQRLTEMLGYNMHYYISAETDVTVSIDVNGLELSGDESFPTTGVVIPQFTAFTDTDGEISFVSTESTIVYANQPKNISCLEGQMCQCESDNNNLITLQQLDDQYRYYLPESQIAENGIFIYAKDTSTSTEYWSERWELVDNLNVASTNDNIYSFRYDSERGLPYLQFAPTISNSIKNGLVIYYIRTNGAGGNISAATLTTFTTPSEWDNNENSVIKQLTADNFTVTNYNSTNNGQDIESMDDAYKNYKKTIGVYDTLVTCRDYMNKIYLLTDNSNNSLVSNVLVTDKYSDINVGTQLITFGKNGIGLTRGRFTSNVLDNFSLLIYPFTSTKSVNSINTYKNSFKIDYTNYDDIISNIEDIKTLSHEILKYSELEQPNIGISCIKNYLKLNAKITTRNTVDSTEEKSILAAIYLALYKNFNMREVEFGEEIPYDSILDVIENADSRIKSVSLDDPTIYTAILGTDGNEYVIYDEDSTITDLTEADSSTAKKLYNQMLLRNILAGNVPLFDINTEIDTQWTQINDSNFESPLVITPELIKSKNLKYLKPECKLTLKNISENNSLQLAKNECIRFRAPSFTTSATYSAYVNYYLKLSSSNSDTKSIKANTEYELKTDEVLYINYTTTTTSSGEEKESIVVNKKLEAGTIIKPNFELSDSKTAGCAYTKTSGFNPDWNIAGMFTLDASSEIAIREPVAVTIQDTVSYFYWITADNSDTFPAKKVDTAGSTSTAPEVTHKYTLQDGEYLFFTNVNKTNMAYYGSGTEVIFYNFNDSTMLKSEDHNKLSVAEILEKGVSAVPWTRVSLGSSTTSKQIKLQEYQYVTLSEGDRLCELSLGSNSDNDEVILTNNWVKCKSAEYFFAGDTEKSSLAEINISADITWEVQSYLRINVGPSTTQELRYISDNNYEVEDSIMAVSDSDSNSITITSKPDSTTTTDSSNCIQLKSSVLIQSGYDKIYLVNLEDYTGAALVDVLLNEGYTSSELTVFEFKNNPFGVYQTTEGKEICLSDRELENFSTGYTTISKANFNDAIKGSTTNNISDIFVPFGVFCPHTNSTVVADFYLVSSGNDLKVAYLKTSKDTKKYSLKNGHNIVGVTNILTENITYKVSNISYSDSGLAGKWSITEDNDPVNVGADLKSDNLIVKYDSTSAKLITKTITRKATTEETIETITQTYSTTAANTTTTTLTVTLQKTTKLKANRADKIYLYLEENAPEDTYIIISNPFIINLNNNKYGFNTELLNYQLVTANSTSDTSATVSVQAAESTTQPITSVDESAGTDSSTEGSTEKQKEDESSNSPDYLYIINNLSRDLDKYEWWPASSADNNTTIDDKSKQLWSDLCDALEALDTKGKEFAWILPESKMNLLETNSTILYSNSQVDETTKSTGLINNPTCLYLKNNINNYCVISEIDSNYLSTGITIARTSKKKVS